MDLPLYITFKGLESLQWYYLVTTISFNCFIKNTFINIKYSAFTEAIVQQRELTADKIGQGWVQVITHQFVWLLAIKGHTLIGQGGYHCRFEDAT